MVIRNSVEPAMESAPASSREIAELSVIVPTLNERANVEPFLERLEEALGKVKWEVVFVDDDSRDGTAALVRQIANRDPRVRIVQRIGRRGLSSASIEGMLSTASPYIAVMDADLQHDESILPHMLEKLKADGLDLVVASRSVEGGSMGEFARKRVLLSGLGRKLSTIACRCELQDPMSGFFALDRRFLEEVAHRLSGLGFKILVDLVASSRRPVRLAEIPYRFRNRLRGESKLDISVGVEYLLLLADKLMGEVIPVRFALFVIVGAMGLLVHLAVLAVLHLAAGAPFLPAQIAATAVAMTFNFLLNNIITYRDRRLRGWKLVTGLALFYGACTVGAVSNFGLAQLALGAGVPWYVSGSVGMIVSSVWNYGVSAALTWRQGRARIRQ